MVGYTIYTNMSSRPKRSLHIKTDNAEIVKVGEWGNSLGVRLPAEMVDEYNIEKEDQIGVRVADDGCLELLPDGD